MFENLQDIDEKLGVLESQLSDPEFVNDQKRYQKVVREHATVSKLAALYGEYQDLFKSKKENLELIRDARRSVEPG